MSEREREGVEVYKKDLFFTIPFPFSNNNLLFVVWNKLILGSCARKIVKGFHIFLNKRQRGIHSIGSSVENNRKL